MSITRNCPSSVSTSVLTTRPCTAKSRRTRSRRPIVAVGTFALLLLASGVAHAWSGGQGPSLSGQERLGNEIMPRAQRPVLFVAYSLDAGPPEWFEIHSLEGGDVEATRYRTDAQPEMVKLSPTEFVDMYWTDSRCDDQRCVPAWYRVVGAARDQHKNGMTARFDSNDVWLYDVQYSTAQVPTDSDWRALCTKDAQGQTNALFVHGTWDRTGAFTGRGYTLACTSGAISKCVRSWGYKPWSQLADRHGVPVALGPLHRACVRAARADYCGSGRSHTRTGTIIDIADRYGFNQLESDPSFTRESGFDENGAVWLERTRLPLDSLPDSAPLTCRPQPFADQSGDRVALLEVRSRP